jgi:ABC-type phosphate transport system substrate-binding protein
MRALVIIGLFTIIVGLAGAAVADDTGYKVIVNRDNPTVAIDRNFLRNAYLKKATTWNHGQTIRPIDLRSPVRPTFTREILNKTPAQLRSFWSQQIFSGKGVAPPEVDTARAVIAYVAAHPGAVGYIPANVDPGATRVVGVK